MNNSAAFDYRKSMVRHIGSIVLGALCLSLASCGPGGEQGPTISTITSATGPTATLVWDPVNDPSIIGYYIHYGKVSPNQSGSCAYDLVQFVSSHQGTITDLDPGSIYYFAVSSYNGMESSCSNEVQTTT